MKKFLSIILLFLAMFSYAAAYSGAVCADISSGILRFHILANSDSSYDQQMKIAVRDYVCQNLSAESRVSSFDEYCGKIAVLANQKLAQENAPYRAQIRLEKVFIPKKSYKNITLPSGYYTAARLMLGSGSGRNWWCVAYPPLCFTEDISGEMSSEGSAALKSSMSRNSYDLITSKAEYRFFIVDLAEKILK